MTRFDSPSMTPRSAHFPPATPMADIRTLDRDLIRDLAADGLAQVEIAARVGCSQSTVSRVLREDRRLAERGPVERAVDAAVGLDEDGEGDVQRDARIAVARALARRLDWAAGPNTGTGTIAAASVARELARQLDLLFAGRPQWDALDEIRARHVRRRVAAQEHFVTTNNRRH